MTKAERAKILGDFLTQEGYRPTVDKDGDITFKHEGGNYVIIIDEKDEAYFQLGYLFFWAIESEVERAKVKEAALAATGETKVAKITVGKDNTHGFIEMFCSPLDNVKSVFPRCLSALRAAVDSFRVKMRE